MSWTADPPSLPPVDECVPVAAGGGIFDQLDLRLDPASAGWMKRSPAGIPEMRGYFRLRDDRPPDAYLLAFAVDALPPVVFGLGAFGWAPTVELTWHMRGVPADGLLRVASRCPARRPRLVRRGGRSVDRPAAWSRRAARSPGWAGSPGPAGNGARGRCACYLRPRVAWTLVRLTVIGCSGSFPGPDSPGSCYLVEAEGFRLLLDLGNGALGALQRYFGLYDVDAICLSHLHADHCLDMCSYTVARLYPPAAPGRGSRCTARQGRPSG